MSSDITPQPGENRPIAPKKAAEPSAPEVLKQEPVNPREDTEFMPTSGRVIGQMADDVRAGITPADSLKFTNRPELLEKGGWILPEGFTVASRGEQPIGSQIQAFEGDQFISSARARDFIPEGQHSYAVMSQFYPELFEDPALQPLQEEFEAQKGRLEALGVSPEVPQVTEADKRIVEASYDADIHSQNVIRQMGVDPYKMDPVGELNYRWKNQQQAVFNQVFGGQIAWADRGQLNKEELAFWNQSKRQWRAQTYQELAAQRTQKIQEYEASMSMFNARKKVHMEALAKAEKDYKDRTKAPTYFKIPNEKGEVTHQYWDPKTRKMVDTGTKVRLNDGDLTPYEKALGAQLSKLRGNAQQNQTAQIIVAANPEMANDPTIQAMMGESANPEVKKAVSAIEAELASLAMARIKASQAVATKAEKVAAEEPTGEEIEKEVNKVPKEEVKTIEDSEGNKVPVYTLTSSDYEIGDILLNKKGDGYAIFIDDGKKAEKYKTVEEVLARRAELLSKKK
jgi:mannose/fructose/N-acetylgalactosamine-specific phosphotransferase system component IIB